MIKSLLIANRGEIACRVIRTARRLGIRTVAVYSDADAKALHVRMADEAVHIGPSPARESYLVGDKIIAAAKQTGAEAIHPGYGFLSENADFAQAVIDAGLIWVGPKPDSIRAMGLKDAAKKLMAEAGVPVTPGYLGEDQDPKRLKKQAGAIGYPVLIKAVAGGGGKGMRRVDDAKDFVDALESAKREAASAFGDDRVLVEKYILSPRHIEVQVFGDSHGNVVHLFERDCSLQRRHQKVIEEAPAPGMDAETRDAVCGAAVRAAKAVNYENAGTIEFIADASDGLRADRIWFMEMNTRLQVEHPVTEEITGQDLVEWQLRVASGEKLPKKQDELAITGHAIEARLYAEDPANNFLPSTGTLEHLVLSMAGAVGSFAKHGERARTETGVECGSTISPYYDPMIAKLIVSADTRENAARALATNCAGSTTWPVRNNAGLLHGLLSHPRFLAGDISTSFVDEEGVGIIAKGTSVDDYVSAAAATLFLKSGGTHSALEPQYFPYEAGNIWRDALGFRLNGDLKRTMRLRVDGKPREAPIGPDWRIVDVRHRSNWRDADGRKLDQESNVLLAPFGWPHLFEFDEPRGTGTSHGLHDGEIEAPMPGKVTAVDVSNGEKVAKGQRLLTLEAMKMEHALTAPFDGTVTELNAKAGAQVTEGQLLVKVEASEQ